jgi:hypothetical protein
MAGNQIVLSSTTVLFGLVILIALARPTNAFGAGNIASTARIEGSNWRHGLANAQN